MSFEIKKNSDGSLTVNGLTEDFLKKAVEHRLYLLDYRKGYCARKTAKIQAMKKALKDRGVDIAKIEQEAVKSLR